MERYKRWSLTTAISTSWMRWYVKILVQLIVKNISTQGLGDWSLLQQHFGLHESCRCVLWLPRWGNVGTHLVDRRERACGTPSSFQWLTAEDEKGKIHMNGKLDKLDILWICWILCSLHCFIIFSMIMVNRRQQQQLRKTVGKRQRGGQVAARTEQRHLLNRH